MPETFELCTEIVRSGGHVANVGVHGEPATLHLEKLWIRDVTITTGLVDTFSTPRLLDLVGAGRPDTSVFATHHFPLDEAMAAYDAFADAAGSGAFKVVLEGARLAETQRPPSSRRPVGSTMARVRDTLLAGPYASAGEVVVLDGDRLAGLEAVLAAPSETPARLGHDPAYGSGPLATVIQDLLSITAYFAIAVALLP